MRRVALFVHTTQGDRMTGGPRMIRTLLAGLRDSPVEPRLVTQRESDLTSAVREAGVEVEIVPLPDGLDVFDGELLRPSALVAWRAVRGWFEYHPAFRALLARVRPSVVWASNLRTLLPAAAACRSEGVPTVWNIWLGQRSQGAMTPLNEIGIRVADRIVTEYRAQATEIFRLRQLERARAKLRTVHTGHAIDPPSPRAARRPGDAFVVGTLGALSPRKDPETFLQLAARVRTAIPEARFLVGGEAPTASLAGFASGIRRRAEDAGLDGCVEWTGWVDDPRAFLSRLDVYVQTSRSEGLPGSVREAMAAAIPVVATDVGGTREAVVPGETGFLAAAGDIAALADAVVRLAREPALAAALGREGRHRFETRFTDVSFIHGTWSVLAELVPGVPDWNPAHASRESHSEITATCSRPSEWPASNVASSTFTPAAASASRLRVAASGATDRSRDP
jgi:glycosyltransferase involved in cell wall biosynthesis